MKFKIIRNLTVSIMIICSAQASAVTQFTACEAMADIAEDIYLYKQRGLPINYLKQYLSDRYSKHDLRREILFRDPKSVDQLIAVIFKDGYPLDHNQTKEMFLKSCLN